MARWSALPICLLALSMGGCAILNGGSTSRIQPVSQSPRIGQVAIVRGMFGVWSVGLDRLSKKINAQGIQATVFQNDQTNSLARTIARNYRAVRDPEPLVIIGHSYGADSAVRIARILNSDHVKVDLLITFDPVTPPPVPPNVQVVLNYHASRGITDNLPWWRGISLRCDPGFTGALHNFDLSTDRPDLQVKDYGHAKIEKDEKIHAEILQWLMKMCPPRKELHSTLISSRHVLDARKRVPPLLATLPNEH